VEQPTEKLLKSRPYQYLISAQLISNLGDWLSLLAVFTLVGLKWNATPLQVSLIILSLALPMTILGPVSGVFADRWERKHIMIVSDLARGLVIFCLIFADQLWHVYTLMFLLGLFSAAFSPAKNGKLKEIVPDCHMQQATSISSVIENGTKIIGPALGGFLLTIWDFDVIFMADSLTFFLSALLLVMIPANQSKKDLKNVNEAPVKNQFFKEMIEGFSFIKNIPFILYGTFLMAITMFVIQMSDSQFVVLFRELKDVSSGLIGLVMTSSGAGFLVTGLILSKFELKKPVKGMAAGILILGLGFGSIGYLTYLQLAMPFIWAPIACFFASAGAGFVFIPFQSNVLRETPSELSGRTLGTIGSVMMLSSLTGPLIGGILANYIGVIKLFIISSSGLCIISVVAFLLRKQFETTKGENHVTQGNGEPQRRAEA
jgi:MFS family permease